MSAPSRLQRAIMRFIEHKRVLGHSYLGEDGVLSCLCRFIRQQGCVDLTPSGFDRWLYSLRDHHANTRRKWHQIARNFCLHRRRAEPFCFVPSDDYAKRQPYISPIIVEPSEVARMINLAAKLRSSPNSPLRGPNARIAVILLYTAGLRLGELLRLTLNDVAEDAALLHIRESKFHKSRWVPLATSTSRELRRFLRLRARVFSTDPLTPLLCNHWHLGNYSHQGMQATINHLFVTAGVHDAHGRRPRVHDLRHSFAVQALLRWFQAGDDVQSSLPKLALFMGHVSIESTAHYLHWIAAVRTAASARFEKHFGQLVTGGVR
jgi:integrase/recombinase XerD